MHLKRTQIEYVARLFVETLKNDKRVTFHGNEEEIKNRVIMMIQANIDEERKLDDTAEKLLVQHRRSMTMEIDENKAFAMIKKQLAKEKGFIL